MRPPSGPRPALSPLLLLAALLLPGCAGGAAEGSVEVVHWDSVPSGDGFREVFQVTAAPDGLEPGEVTVTVDGTAIDVLWEGRDGADTVGPGDRFAFTMESSDARRELRIVAHGKLLAHLEFGSGAGTPVEASS